MLLVIDRRGTVQGLYGEVIDLAALGLLSIRRASHVEPDDQDRWWADLRHGGRAQARSVHAAIRGVERGSAVAGTGDSGAASGSGVIGRDPVGAGTVRWLWSGLVVALGWCQAWPMATFGWT